MIASVDSIIILGIMVATSGARIRHDISATEDRGILVASCEISVKHVDPNIIGMLTPSFDDGIFEKCSQHLSTSYPLSRISLSRQTDSNRGKCSQMTLTRRESRSTTNAVDFRCWLIPMLITKNNSGYTIDIDITDYGCPLVYSCSHPIKETQVRTRVKILSAR